MSSEELEDLEDHAFDIALGKTLEELNEQEILLSEAAPALEQIAKEYNLRLGVLSDFRIARAIWAKSLKRITRGLCLNLLPGLEV